MATREKENRLYTDEEVALLPFVQPTHTHAGEWRVRKRSADRLLTYLREKNTPLSILEVGCGNGWLAARLADLKESTVNGIDVNERELNQAKRVFGDKSNIQFLAGEFSSHHFRHSFDVIVFAAVIQYFPSFSQTIGEAITLLNPEGEIHILDSHFYDQDEIKQAGQRSFIHYQSIGFEEMAKYYFHHTLESLDTFHYKILYNPRHFKNMFFPRKDPFPWICITAS
jgi:ubiquinone/menaquinone biosynthesis C-methylase UbiE